MQRVRVVRLGRRAARGAAEEWLGEQFGGRQPRASFGDPSFEALLRAAQTPTLGKCVGDSEADVVRRTGVLAAGIAEPDDQPVDGPATATEGASQELLLPTV